MEVSAITPSHIAQSRRTLPGIIDAIIKGLDNRDVRLSRSPWGFLSEPSTTNPPGGPMLANRSPMFADSLIQSKADITES